MSRFTNDTFRSLNESIARVQNPQAALDEAMEYTAILEEVILSLCEELDLDPQALVEDAVTAGRKSELSKKEWDYASKGQGEKSDKIVDRHNREQSSRKYLYRKGGGRTLIPKKGTAKRAAYDKKIQSGKIIKYPNP